MAETPKILAQHNPAAAGLEDMYTAPAAGYASGRLNICNRSGTATSFRVAVAPAGAADDPKQYVAYDEAIGSNARAPSILIFMGPGDVLRVYATLATLSFSFMGAEFT